MREIPSTGPDFCFCGDNMKKYEILDVQNQDYFCSVRVAEEHPHTVKLDSLTLSGVKRITKTIDLPAGAAQKLKVGQHIIVLQSKCSEDYAYLYHNGVCLNTEPVSDDKYSCGYYIKNLPGIFNECKLDRIVFKAVLLCECKRRNIRASLFARRNLQKLFARDGFVAPER